MKTDTRRPVWLQVLFISAALAAVGCQAGLPPVPTDPPQGGTPAPAAAGKAGSAGQAGSRDVMMVDAHVTLPVTPPPPAAPPVMCGTSQCEKPPNVAGDLLRGIPGLSISVPDAVSCCVDAAHDVCGSAAMLGEACDVPAQPFPACPGVDLSAITALVDGLGDGAKRAMVGCCTHGMCGLDGNLFGRGCVENADARRMLSTVPIVGPLIHVPDAMHCPGGPQPDDRDAGM